MPEIWFIMFSVVTKHECQLERPYRPYLKDGEG